MDAEEGREKKRVNLVADPSNGAMVQRDLHLLPREILLEILSRLPVKSLIHFKSTSRAGRDLIADPRLPQMFLNRVRDSDPCLILFNHGLFDLSERELYFVDSEDCRRTGRRRVRKIQPPQHLEVSDLVGSCNGLLCLSLIGASLESHSLLIYNPFVGDAVRIPPSNRFPYQREVFGFGFHPTTGEFKVVSIVRSGMNLTVVDPALDVKEADESMVLVFTVGTTDWRNKGAPPTQLAGAMQPPAVLFEGSLHWVTVGGMGGVSDIFGIISFELAHEVFEEIPHPPSQRFVSRRYSLSVLNGCLSAARLVETGHFDIWVMKQYPVKESWVKQFSFDSYFAEFSFDPFDPYFAEFSFGPCFAEFSFGPCFAGAWPSFSTVICTLKNGEILLQNDESSLVSYDPVENRFKTLQMSGLPNASGALPFLPSPFSAKATMNLQL